MSRIATLDIAFNALLTQARADRDEFIRETESRVINIPLSASGQPTPATFGGGPTAGGNAVVSAFSAPADTSLRLTDLNARQGQLMETSLASARAMQAVAERLTSAPIGATAAAGQSSANEEDGGGGSGGGLTDNNFLRRATSRLTRGAGVYFALREINSAVQGYQQQQAGERTLADEGGSAYISQQRSQAEGRLQDGLGTIVREGFSVAGKWLGWKADSDQEQYDALTGARNSLAKTNAGDQTISMQAQYESGLRRTNEQIDQLGIRDPFAARSYQNFAQQQTSIDQLHQKDTDLRQQYASATSSGDTVKANELAAQINELAKEFSGLTDSIGRLRTAADKRNQDDYNLYASGRTNSINSARDAMAGNFLQSATEAIDAQMGVQRDAQGNVVSIHGNRPGSAQFGFDNQSLDIANQQAGAGEVQRVRDYENITTAAGQELAGDTRAAQRTRIEGERADALSPGGISLTNAPEIARINARYDTLEQQSEQQRQYGIFDVNQNQSVRQQRIAAQLARDPIAAQVAQITGSTRTEETDLLRRGPDFAAQAANARTLGQGALDVLAQNYKDSFRGEALDLRTNFVGNPRDVEDPTKILKEISDARNGLGAPGTTGAKDGAGGTTSDIFNEIRQNLPRNIAYEIAHQVKN